MPLLIDFLPIVIFFVVFKLYGIYLATAAIILASLLQLLVYRIKTGRFSTLPLVAVVIMVVLGGATLLWHDTLFIKWKVTVVDGVFALLLLATQWTDRPTLKRLLGQKMHLPGRVWKQLNLSWALFFIGSGLLNLYVAYHYSITTWVHFKLFGLIGLTLVFLLGQAVFLSRYLKDNHQ